MRLITLSAGTEINLLRSCSIVYQFWEFYLIEGFFIMLENKPVVADNFLGKYF